MSVAVVAAGDAAVIAGGRLAGLDQLGAAAAVHRQAEEPLVETLDAASVKAQLQEQIAAMGGEEDLVPDVPPAELRGALEAVLLVANRPLSVERLGKLLPGIDPGYLDGFLTGLSERFTVEARGWDLRHIAGGWQLLTRPLFHPWVRQMERKELPTSLSKSAMETLAIVAYQQPISRGHVDDIRGVQSGPMLRQLMDLKLVQMVGRSEELLGKPLLYGTTDLFLERFGLGSPDDLPRRHELGI